MASTVKQGCTQWCVRQFQHLLTDPRSLAALDVTEKYANGQATDDELDAAWNAAYAAVRDAAQSAARAAAWTTAFNAAHAALHAAAWDAAHAAQEAEFRRVFG